MLVLQNVTISDLVSQCISKSRSDQLGMFIAPYFLVLIVLGFEEFKMLLFIL